MEIVNGIIEDKVRQIWENNNMIVVSLCNEQCICYGEGSFNNPTNLPTYHTHLKGGIIVCFNGDINFCISSHNRDIGKQLLVYLEKYLLLKGKTQIINNDLLYNDRKVASFSVIAIGNKYIITFHISIGMNLELVKKICTKFMIKQPGGLSQFGFSQQSILNYMLPYLKKFDVNYVSNNDPIDICVMWVDPTSKRWQEEYEKYRKIEIDSGKQLITSKAAFETARYRDWNIFKYFFRGVEQNCSWVNKVFLIVEDEDQIPSWLDRNHPKLRIVYHKEFIPNEALPQFNGPAIETWYSNIPDLSENFIACDDDYIFYNKIPESLFFENNSPQTEIVVNSNKPTNKTISNWETLMYNDYLLQKKITGNKTFFICSHLPEARNKSFEAKILKENYSDFYSALTYSHFRSNKGLTAWVLSNIAKVLGISKNKPIYQNSKYIPLGIPCSLALKTAIQPTFDMICLNDVGGDIDKIKPIVIDILQEHFPNKSSFEL